MSLARDLLGANDIFLDQLADVFDCATNYNQQGIANFIAGAIDDQAFYKWQLTASLGEEVTQSAIDPLDANGMDADDAEAMMPSMEMMSSYSAEPVTDEERASAARIGEGSFVSWDSSGGRARGKVEKVITKGPASSDGGFTLEATPDYPVFQIRVYEAKGNGWIPTDVVVVHRNDLLTIITPLPSPRSEEIDMESRKSRMATAERVTMDCEVRALSTDSTSLRIGGYAAQFNKEATGLSFREVIAPGAFTRTLDSGEPVFLLVNHDTDNLPLASTQSGTMSLRQDETGLYMEADLDPNNPRAQELASAVSRGDVSKMSFAFTVAPGGDTREAGLRTLQDLNLFEVSVVTWPAYDATTVGMRTASAEDAEAEALELRKRMLDLKQKFSNSKNR
jgi:HK97 family phage prohead protease